MPLLTPKIMLRTCYSQLGGFGIFFIFTPKIGEDSHFDEYFSTGLFNHQLRHLYMS